MNLFEILFLLLHILFDTLKHDDDIEINKNVKKFFASLASHFHI